MSDLTAVIIGIVAGVLASIPVSGLILALTGGLPQRRIERYPDSDIVITPLPRQQLAAGAGHQVIVYDGAGRVIGDE